MKESKIPLAWLLPIGIALVFIGWLLRDQGLELKEVAPIPGMKFAPPAATNARHPGYQPSPSTQPLPSATQASTVMDTAEPIVAPTICYGKSVCWQYDVNTRTMTWTGPTDGTEDVWQGDELSLSRVRDGWKVVLGL